MTQSSTDGRGASHAAAAVRGRIALSKRLLEGSNTTLHPGMPALEVHRQQAQRAVWFGRSGV